MYLQTAVAYFCHTDIRTFCLKTKFEKRRKRNPVVLITLRIWIVYLIMSHGTIMRRPEIETFSALLAICADNSPVPGDFPAQRAVTRSFDVFFDLCLNKRLSKQLRGWWFQTPSRPLWRQCNGLVLPGSKPTHWSNLLLSVSLFVSFSLSLSLKLCSYTYRYS